MRKLSRKRIRIYRLLSGGILIFQVVFSFELYDAKIAS